MNGWERIPPGVISKTPGLVGETRPGQNHAVSRLVGLTTSSDEISTESEAERKGLAYLGAC